MSVIIFVKKINLRQEKNENGSSTITHNLQSYEHTFKCDRHLNVTYDN